MSVDPSVLKAVETAVDADEGNLDLARHLVQLLIDAGDGHAALSRARSLVGVAPGDPDVLRSAVAAAEAAGDSAAADRFATALRAYEMTPQRESVAPQPEEPPEPEPSGEAEVVRLKAI